MNEVVEAAVAGASLAAGAAIWLLAGYLIQRFAFRNPEPTYAIVFATSLSASMLLFSFVALLTFHIRNNAGAANGLVHTVDQITTVNRSLGQGFRAIPKRGRVYSMRWANGMFALAHQRPHDGRKPRHRDL